MKKLSIVISAFNEENNIEDCLKSVQNIASEIILIDNSSVDETINIAKKYTNKIFSRKNNLMLNINKNFGISKATNEWVLLLDADERITEDLERDIRKVLENNDVSINGYFMPRKNMIFGKWIQHTGWYPDKQLRLFRRKRAKFAEKHIHEMIEVSGEVGELESPLYHLNYVNVSQFLDKMIRVYTISEANSLINSGYKISIADAILMPTKEFVKRFFAEKGYKDGSHGLMLSLLMAFYHFVVFLRVWEAKSYPDSKDILKEFESAQKESFRQISYWMITEKIYSEKNPIKKILQKTIKKIS